MQMNAIQQRIKEYITSEFVVDQAQEIDLDTPLLEKGIIDSVSLFHLIDFVQQNFSIEVRDEDLLAENFGTLRKIAEYVELRLAAEKNPAS
jgi:acyl carrier protein